MAENIAVTPGSGKTILADEVTLNAVTGIVGYGKLLGGADNDDTRVHAGGGVEANALRVTIANDSTGVVSVDDNGSTLSVDDGGGSLTVDGTVAVSSSALPTGAATSANQSSEIALLTTIDADTGSIDGKLAALQSTNDDITPASGTPVVGLMYGYQTSGSNWDKVRVTGDNSDAVGTATTGHMNTMAHNMMYNGTTWDRVRGSTTDGLLVNLGANNDVTVTTSALPTGAATEAKQDSMITQETASATSLAIMDDWDESDRAKVNPIVGQAGVAAGAGAVGATVQRVTLASDDPAVTAVQTQSSFDHARTAVGTSAVQLQAGSIAAKKGVLVKAANANTGRVYVGNSDVTAGSTAATDGFELANGESIFLEIDNVNKVYVIASASSQNVYWTVI